MQFEMDNSFKDITNIKVIGVGGGGGNAINRMVEMQIDGVELITVNTDKQALCFSKAPTKIQIGEKITGGRGAGANPEIGRMAADESREAIEEVLNDTQMVFITAGMGGGTGTGAAPVIAEIARSKDILTVGIVTKPFAFEGKHRMQQAEAGIAELAGNVDSLIIIPNERLKNVSVEKITLANGFKIANDVLVDGVRSISDLIVNAALINLDFADVTAVMKNAGHAHMGIGRARGKDRAEQAVKAARLEAEKEGVDLKPEDSEDDEMVITVIATGFGDNAGKPSSVGSFFKEESPLLYPMDDISSTSSDEASGDSSTKYSEFIDIINGKK